MSMGTDQKLAGVIAILCSLGLAVVIVSIATGLSEKIIMIAFLTAAIPSVCIAAKFGADWSKRTSPAAINAARRELRDRIAERLDRAGWRVETDKMLRTSNPLPAQLLLPMVAYNPNGTVLVVYPHSSLEKESAHFSWVASAEHGGRALQAIEKIDATPVIVAPAGDQLIEDFSRLAGEVNVELIAPSEGTPAKQVESILEELLALAERVGARRSSQMTMELPSEIANAEKLSF